MDKPKLPGEVGPPSPVAPMADKPQGFRRKHCDSRRKPRTEALALQSHPLAARGFGTWSKREAIEARATDSGVGYEQQNSAMDHLVNRNGYIYRIVAGRPNRRPGAGYDHHGSTLVWDCAQGAFRTTMMQAARCGKRPK